jgi:hypothetical protein
MILSHLRSPGDGHPELKFTIIRFWLQLTIQLHRPSLSNPFGRGCANEDSGFVNEAFFERLIQGDHAVIIDMLVPRAHPTAFSSFSNHLEVQRGLRHIR